MIVHDDEQLKKLLQRICDGYIQKYDELAPRITEDIALLIHELRVNQVCTYLEVAHEVAYLHPELEIKDDYNKTGLMLCKIAQKTLNDYSEEWGC